MEEGDEDETKELEMDAEEDEEFMDIKRQLLLEYPDVFANDLLGKTMKGESVHLSFDPNSEIRPFNVSSCRPTEVKLKAAVERVTQKFIED